jgi:hypothetical protein
MKMATKKLYVAIAKNFKDQLAYCDTLWPEPTAEKWHIRRALRDVAEGVALVLKQDNGAFRHDTFMSACGFDAPEEAKPTPNVMVNCLVTGHDWDANGHCRNCSMTRPPDDKISEYQALLDGSGESNL